MKYLAKIKDSYIFNKNSYKSHWYFVYLDKNKNVKYLRELTHLFIKDKNRFAKIRKGYLEKKKIDIFDTASGLYKNKIYKDINGNKFTRGSIKNNAVYRRFKFKILK